MGQQQLLLIALGVILVGVAVVLGIQYFQVGAEQGAKDELVAHCITIGSNAQQWFSKPVSMDGGGLAFTGFDTYFTTNMANLATSTNGTYTVAATAPQAVITGTPAVALGYTWKVECTVESDTMWTKVVPQ